MSKDILSWDEYFMGIALMSSFRSKDPNSKVGACIVNPKNRIVGIGYNGFPTGCDDDKLSWEQNGPFLETKYPYVCHAELNAILNSNCDLSDCRLYIRLFPCNECAKAIIQAGIREIVYLCYNRSPDSDIFVASRKLLDMAGVACRKLDMSMESLVIDFKV